MMMSKRFVREDAGATMVEYSLILGLVAVAFVAAITAMGGTVAGLAS